jgi:ABC-type transporter Mla MlaB component
MIPNDSLRRVGTLAAADQVVRLAASEAPPAVLDIRRRPASVVHASGELDSAHPLAEALEALARPGSTIELDLADPALIDSSGLRVLCCAADRLGPHGRLVVSHPRTAVLGRSSPPASTSLVPDGARPFDREPADRLTMCAPAWTQ